MPELEPESTRSPTEHLIDPQAIADSARPNAAKLNVRSQVLDADGSALDSYAREDEIAFGASADYAQLAGVTTFRGNHYRDSAAYGDIGGEPSAFTYRWSHAVGGLDSWTGVGWTGQCAIVRWSPEVRAVMNLYPEKQAKDDLVEVIYAALDGHIYFLDLDDGAPTRDAIDIGAPIKGSVTVDPRGYPLLYCGQGIPEVRGKSVPIGTRIFSLIDSSVLYFLNGRDSDAYRGWHAFDAAPLIDAATDTMLQLGENGIFYLIQLNTAFDSAAGTVAVDPQVVKYRYQSDVSTRPGMENSVAAYNRYAYFADNSGLLQCVDLNTLALLWAFDAGDDTDATLVIEPEDGGVVALYTANELDLRGADGYCDIRKIDARTGEQIWLAQEYCVRKGDTNGGAFATPALGKGSLSDYIYFHIARTREGGTLLCIEKETGAVHWQRSLHAYGWSSPVCVYAETGRGYVAVASSSGQLRLLDGLTGDLICDADLKSNIEGSPAVFGDTLVVGTRGGQIVAVGIE